MNIRRTVFGPFPPLTLTYDELKQLVNSQLKGKTGSFDFNSIINVISQYVVTNDFGYNPEPNTTYEEGLSQVDQNLIREILWDFIIARYLTPGGNGHGEWPSITITERGKAYFNQDI